MNTWRIVVPPVHQPRVDQAIGAAHRDRVRVIAPSLLVFGMWLVGSDLYLLSVDGHDSWLEAYLWLDCAFLAANFTATVVAWVRSRGLTWVRVCVYVSAMLLWSVSVGVIEFHRDGNYTAVLMTILAGSAVALMPPGVFTLLSVLTVVLYHAVCALWPGSQPLSFERSVALVGVVIVAVGLSRALHLSFVRGIIANAELQNAKLSLIRQEKLASLGVLAAGIAHEVNNPLSFIKSNLTTLERNHAELTGPPEVLEENRQIFDETRHGFLRIAEVVRALGDFGRSNTDQSFEPYDLSAGVQTTLHLSRHERGSIAVELELNPVPQVLAHGSEINQVILNLLLNAYHAVHLLPAGHPQVVGLRLSTAERHVVLEVWNSGPPVAPDLRERIFEPFFSTKPPGEGSGLGLSLSWEIVVARHGGRLELLESEPVTFRLQLPLQASTQSTK